MQRPLRQLFSAAMITVLSLSCANAQTDPGGIGDLLDADFAPLQTNAQQLPELNSPLIMGEQQVQLPPVPQVFPQQPQSVLETPGAVINQSAPEQLILPDLTIPTPENTAATSREDRRSLKPQFDALSQDRIELLPFDNDDTPSLQARIRIPQMSTPQALNYRSQTYTSRSLLRTLPIQIEFFSETQSFGYQPYGVYRPGGYGYRSYGGAYRPYSGYQPYGRYRPYGGHRDGGRRHHGGRR
ncbi:hypothetical protein [Mariniblastus fucicola]|uniref:DUF3300 domain-containing protein n=1 Tax=Mariniblastus fucicola TaxID=980251 RepID=A0A5B9PJ08_9BACT|nr:hypothetical protein [Mariniblastus fucicola]QEG25240.1 hypothetical protein MFFC18_51640 [Mariniblastus fucicola]